MLFFQLPTWVLALIVLAVILGATLVGLLIGRSTRKQSEELREPFSVMQAVLLGFMSLVLAFGLSLAVGRYQDRRAATVSEANAIGTTYLRAETLHEPLRSASMELLRKYTDVSIRIAKTRPDSSQERDAIADSSRIERQLWDLAGRSLDQAPVDTAPRLYVESLNEMFDAQSTRVSSLSNRVPTAVLFLELVVAAIALGSLGLHLSTMGRAVLTVLVAVLLVASTLLVTFDLDRPTRGLIRVPDGPLIAVRAEMALPAAAPAPTGR